MRGVVPNDMSSTCAQGAIPRPARGYPSIMGRLSPATAWQYQHSALIPKQEPMDQEERNDSGISGSDFQSSSPGSDHSDNKWYLSPSTSSSLQHSAYYPPVAHQEFNGMPMFFTNDLNPLTPPSSEPMASPKNIQSVTPTSSNAEDNNECNAPQNTLTPCTSPEENTDALKDLEIAMAKTGFLPPPISPNPSESSKENANINTDKNAAQAAIYVQKVNSHGKVKKFKCKQCGHAATTKSEFWAHSKIHIKEDKLLTCPTCPFVTEYKHHFEYHIRNHTGSKPFKCDQCTYACVNKSMLNSHLKSHSEVYQYGCADCRYVTKYVHSLKIHLRKYTHKPAMVRNPDGTPNPLPVIDVYGTRRGPKIKFQKQKTVQETPPPPPPQPQPQPDAVASFPFTHFMLNTPQVPLPFPPMAFLPGLPGAIPNPYLLQLEALMLQNQNSLRENQAASVTAENGESQSQQIQPESEVLDLSKPPGQPPQKNRRKGRAFKLAPEQGNTSDDDEELTNMFSNVEVVENIPAETSAMEESSNVNEDIGNSNSKDDYNCQFCLINFGDPILYTMHMGYHDFQDPFKCNMCGEKCADKVSFFLHIARTPHS